MPCRRVAGILLTGALMLAVAAALAGQPAYQLLGETRLPGGVMVQEVRRVEANLWYRLLPPLRYLKLTGVLGMAPGTEPPYPGKKLDWTYPVFHHPDPAREEKLNRAVEELLCHPRGVGRGIEYEALITWRQGEDLSLELTYHRSYYPFFAVRPLEDEGRINLDMGKIE